MSNAQLHHTYQLDVYVFIRFHDFSVMLKSDYLFNISMNSPAIVITTGQELCQTFNINFRI